MQKELNTHLAGIIVLALFCGYIFAPIPNKPGGDWFEKTFKLNLGIDLQGGAEVVYRAYDLDHAKEIDDRAVTQRIADKIRKRIDRRGLKEPRVHVRGNDMIQIQLAGIDAQEWAQYKSIVERMGHLELLEVAAPDIQKRYLERATAPDDPTYRICPHANSGERLVLLRKPIATGEQVVGAGTRHVSNVVGGKIVNEWVVTFRLDKDGARRFHDATKRLWEINQKLPRESPDRRRIAIVLDGKIESAPSIEGAIREEGQITGTFKQQDAKDLAVVLETGGLSHPIGRLDKGQTPAKFTAGQPEFESLVGPSLGQDAIRRGISAVVLGFVLVALFMIVYYRMAGIVAVVTLILNLLFLMTLLALFRATLTLPGIAGIVLTVGMAVDANILILERVREELAKNKTTLQAFEHGYERALSAIIDGNVTTFIVAAVLFMIGVGTVAGFAVTLILGIATTLFSALYCGRVITRILLARGGIKTFKMMRVLSNPSFRFVKYMRPAFIGSVAMIAGAILLGILHLPQALGFDFKGGCVVALRTSEETDIDRIRDVVAKIQDPEGKLRYNDAEIQILSDPDEKRLEAVGRLGVTRSRHFKITTSFGDVEILKEDLARAFADLIQPPPFERLEMSAVTNPAERAIMDRQAAAGFVVNLRKEGTSFDRAREAIRNAAPAEVSKNPQGFKYVGVHEGEPRGDFMRLRVLLSKEDFEAHGVQLIADYETSIETASKRAGSPIALSENPFVSQDTMGPSAARELRDSTVWAMVISWILMVVYIWFRFHSVKFGAAAVLALVHDALLTLGVILVLHWIVPVSFGLSFEVNLAMLAGILTIIGYSINDTIVTFDRIRENILLMKRSSFSEILDASINQTLSRTLITAVTTWIAVAALYATTMTSSGGVSGLALPLVIGLVFGTYSSIYIAAPVLFWWFRGQRPEMEKAA
jgi:SecD/SecF fusion protein